MKFERIENGYRLTDVAIAAGLLCMKDMEWGVEKIPGKTLVWIVIKDDPEKIKDWIDDWFNGRLKVDPRKFSSYYKDIKARIFCENGKGKA